MKTKLLNFSQCERQSAVVEFLTALYTICAQRIRYKLTITRMASLTNLLLSKVVRSGFLKLMFCIQRFCWTDLL